MIPIYFLFEKTAMRDLVKDPDWQKLRQSLVGTWKLTPEQNVKKIRKYLGPIRKTENRKLTIVMNYLTGSGFRIGRISHPSITKLRKEVSNEIKRRKQLGTYKRSEI